VNPLRSNYPKSKSEVEQEMKQIAKKEIKRQQTEICPNCAKRLQHQVLATVFWILHREYGHTAKWINGLKSKIELEFDLMDGLPNFDNVAYSPDDLIKSLKEIGVDLDASDLAEGDV
jgi:hypothetical protein